MNKSLLVLLVVVVLAAGGAAVYFTQKPKLDARLASASAGELPAGTVALLSAPDLNKAAADWKTTDLYKIWTEPQVQAFFAKPLSKVPENKEINDTLDRIGKLDLKNLFIALTALDEKDNRPHIVAGFEFTGNFKDVDALLAKPKDLLREKFPAGKADLAEYQGHSIESFNTGDGDIVASTYAGQRYLIGNDVDLLKKTLDRIEGRAPVGEATLEKDADFQAVSAKLPKNHVTFAFARPQAFLSKIYTLAAASGQPIDAEKRAEAEKLRAVGATTTIEDGKLRDSIYTFAPGYKKSATALGMGALSLSSSDTLLYLASVLNLPDKLDVPKGLKPPVLTLPAPGATPNASPDATPDAATATADATPSAAPAFQLDLLKMFVDGLESKGITWEGFRAAFGQEASVLLDWPTNSPQPALLASLDVRDRAAVSKYVDNVIGLMDKKEDGKDNASADGWQTTDAGGVKLHYKNVANSPFFSPTIAVTDKHLVLSLNVAGAQSAITREKAGGANFTAGEVYKKGAATLSKPNQVTGYLDSKTLFERVYGALKPMAVMGIMFYPQANDYVEVGKLPDAETISKHLSPIVLSQVGDDQGVLMESRGPVTFVQATMGVVVGAGAAAVPLIKQKMGLGLPKGDADEAPADAAETPEDATEDPDITPQSSPASTP